MHICFNSFYSSKLNANVIHIRDMGITRMLNRNPPACRRELVMNVIRIVSSVTYKKRDLSFSQNLCSSLMFDVSFVSPVM